MPGTARALLAAVVCGLLAAGAPAAQETAQVTVPSPVLTVDQNRLYAESAFGRAALAASEAAEAALQAENQVIFDTLEAEERDLADRRATLAADEFSALAQAFDDKVERIRGEQDAKGQAIAQTRRDDQQRFFTAALPELARLMGELGAVALLDKGAIILSFEAIDVTDEAIARLDQALGDGSGGAPAPQTPDQTPDRSPDPAPDPTPDGPDVAPGTGLAPTP